MLCPGGVKTRIMFSERNRPERYGGPETPRAPEGSLPPNPIDPEIVARLVVEAVPEDAPYIVTHKVLREGVEARYNEILAAFDKL